MPGSPIRILCVALFISAGAAFATPVTPGAKAKHAKQDPARPAAAASEREIAAAVAVVLGGDLNRIDAAADRLIALGKDGQEAFRKVLDEWIARLGDGNFDTREKAHQVVAQLAPLAPEQVREAFKNELDLEIRRHLKPIVARLSPETYDMDAVIMETLRRLRRTKAARELTQVMESVVRGLEKNGKTIEALSTLSKKIAQLNAERGKVVRPGFKYDVALKALEEEKAKLMKALKLDGVLWLEASPWETVFLIEHDHVRYRAFFSGNRITVQKDSGGTSSYAQPVKLSFEEVFPIWQDIGRGRKVPNTLLVESKYFDTNQIQGNREVKLENLVRLEKEGKLEGISVPLQLHSAFPPTNSFQLGLWADSYNTEEPLVRAKAVQEFYKGLFRDLTDGYADVSPTLPFIDALDREGAFTIPRPKRKP